MKYKSKALKTFLVRQSGKLVTQQVMRTCVITHRSTDVCDEPGPTTSALPILGGPFFHEDQPDFFFFHGSSKGSIQNPDPIA